MSEASMFENKIYACVNVITDHSTKIQKYTHYYSNYTKLSSFNGMYSFFINKTSH